MRLRFIVPRRGRRAGLGGLASALALAACGGGAPAQRILPASVPSGPAPAGLAIGIDEKNPHLLAPGDQPEPFARFRDALVALHPTYVRVLVDWSVVQPAADAAPDFDQPKDGCARGLAPCAPYGGLRDTLRAVLALRATPVLLIYGTPAWAARSPAGCERDGVTAYARTPRTAPYRALVRAVLALLRSEGSGPAYLSPWNEPNTPTFFNPQRAGCSARSRALSPERYARLARVAADEAGVDRLLLGETAGIDAHTHAVGAAEFAAALPDDLVCGAAGWAQHAYVTAPRDAGAAADPVPPGHNSALVRAVERALGRHGCGRPVAVWITETGAGDRPGACAAMAAQLRAWGRDPQIRAAFQYTLRDDPIFPVGLADAGLTRLYPAYEAWRTRGATRC